MSGLKVRSEKELQKLTKELSTDLSRRLFSFINSHKLNSDEYSIILGEVSTKINEKMASICFLEAKRITEEMFNLQNTINKCEALPEDERPVYKYLIDHKNEIRGDHVRMCGLASYFGLPTEAGEKE